VAKYAPIVTRSEAEGFDLDIAVVGGCGHVGLPLGISLADTGLRVALYDIDAEVVALVQRGGMPFEEPGAPEVLQRALENGTLEATGDPGVIARSEHVIVVIGTPIDEHLNPAAHVVPDAIREIGDQLRDGQLLILRSTVYPGVTALVEGLIDHLGVDVDVAFCPERIAEGHAMTELRELPQIVAGRTPQAAERARELFHRLTEQTVELSPEEAELAKLFTNAWRYIKFAAANQFFMIANEFGADFEKIRNALAYEYPRAADMPGAGFAAGPCLLKDTMQLAAFNNNNFALGQASMMINEGLPLYVISRIEKRFDLSDMTVGLLGMAFKADSDDIRASLSYKLKRILKLKAQSVLCTDPHVTVDPELVPLEDVLERADLLIIAAPHKEYGALSVRTPIVDIWGVSGNGTRV
jgi:UDP-N-acetyl-D-mannosaminuronic acid dehydrogenase